MTPEAAHYLGISRTHLAKARDFLKVLHYSDEAGRAAYLAGFNAAQALIFTRNGRIARTHRGLRSTFAHLAQAEPGLDQTLTQFLARAYRSKEIADYGNDADSIVTEAEAQEMIDIAARFVDKITEILA